MRIAAVASTLSGGGAARALVQVCNHWAAQGRELALLTLDEPEEDFYPLAPGIHRSGLGLRSPSGWIGEAVLQNLRRATALRRAIARLDADVVVAVDQRTDALVTLAVAGLGVPVVVWKQIDPRRAPLSTGWRLLRRVAYRRADRLVVQVDRLRPWARRYTAERRIGVIPNPAPAWRRVRDPRRSGVASVSAERIRTVLAVGRLVPQKGFDRLIDAFARAAADRPEWRLVIVGEGAERGALTRRAADRNLADRFELPGRTSEVEAYYGSADLFVLPSRFEGFPNVLLEAMVAGLPVIAFDCPTGPREIIRDGVDGVLVSDGDMDELARQMGRIMDGPELRERLAERATEVGDRFGVERIGCLWDEIFDELL